jgi:hypothetical protein
VKQQKHVLGPWLSSADLAEVAIGDVLDMAARQVASYDVHRVEFLFVTDFVLALLLFEHVGEVFEIGGVPGQKQNSVVAAFVAASGSALADWGQGDRDWQRLLVFGWEDVLRQV